MSNNHSCDLPIGAIDNCQICQSTNFQSVVDMGFAAPCDSLLTVDQLRQPEASFPLKLKRCRDCGLVQIDHVVDPVMLFHTEYPYRSGITETLKRNLHTIASHVSEKVNVKKGALAVDIGSNDGTVLEGFKFAGMKVLGIEPTKIAEIARAADIETLNEFFSPSLAKQIVASHGHATVVNASNVFAHINQLSSLLNGIHDLLEDDGVFVSESHYMLDILETLQYDSIYHEHLRFYLIKPLQKLFDDHGFTLEDVERISNYGGSIRVYARKGRERKVNPTVNELCELEKLSGCYDDTIFNQFRDRIESSRSAIRSLVVKIRDEGKSIVGIGCPGRAMTLLTYCGLTPDLIPYIAEQSSSLKLGLFTPGTHIPVVDEKRMLMEQPDYALMLSWHYAEPIIRTLRAKGLKSKIIVPLPEVTIFD